MSDKHKEVEKLIQGCKEKRLESRKLLYKHFYSYAFGICVRYSSSQKEAKTIMNDGFMTVFTQIMGYHTSNSFADWLCKVMIGAAIAYYHNNHAHADNGHNGQGHNRHMAISNRSFQNKVPDSGALGLLHMLSPKYRLVYSLHAIDGYAHKAIAKQLNISANSSEAIFRQARHELKQMLPQVPTTVGTCPNTPVLA